jgi:hypothetical protein
MGDHAGSAPLIPALHLNGRHAAMFKLYDFYVGLRYNILWFLVVSKKNVNIKLRGFSPQANYTDRATAVCRRS